MKINIQANEVNIKDKDGVISWECADCETVLQKVVRGYSARLPSPVKYPIVCCNKKRII